ncbi:hypothetical protein [Flavobacterium sp.]|jgi:hypothetical protein|uniref:hypothetical protein n=1 Tax=Flavobacterium sp. TaxID=239 RepID=UPI00391DAE83
MKHKLVLIFADDSEVIGVDSILMFNNVLDAETYLLGTGHITKIKIETDDKLFSFKTNSWDGNGRAYWVVDRS